MSKDAHDVGGPFVACGACAANLECRELGACIVGIYEEAEAAHAAYIAAGVCSGCKATSEDEARALCRPQQDQSGEWSCAGEELWPASDDDAGKKSSA